MTDDEAQLLRAMWDNPHMTVRAMAEQLHITPPSVSRRAHGLGLPPRRPDFRRDHRGHLGREGRRAQLQALWGNPWRTRAGIAMSLGIGEATVYRWARALGLPDRRQIRSNR